MHWIWDAFVLSKWCPLLGRGKYRYILWQGPEMKFSACWWKLKPWKWASSPRGKHVHCEGRTSAWTLRYTARWRTHKAENKWLVRRIQNNSVASKSRKEGMVDSVECSWEQDGEWTGSTGAKSRLYPCEAVLVEWKGRSHTATAWIPTT
jgi:hypothetical protein